MARRGSNEEAVTETPTEEAVTEETEAPKEQEKEIDLTDFQAVANAAVAEADSTTGEVPKESLVEVTTSYRGLDGIKAKNAARSWVEAQMIAAIHPDRNIVKAKAFVLVKDSLSAGSSKTGGTSTPKDPTEAFVSRVAVLAAANDLIMGSVPEGVDADWTDKASVKAGELVEAAKAYQAALDAAGDDEDVEAVSAEVRKVVKLSSGKSNTGTYTGGPRRSVLNHIAEAFANEEVGAFLTINEIVSRESKEYGENGAPSPGAVSSRLFPPSGKAATLPAGIEASAEEGRARGATKVA